jgi:uncharacterized repeat protein (TIGR03943 family)
MNMSSQTINRLKVSVLIGLAIYFAYVYLTGKLAIYIEPRFNWLSIVGVLLFAVLALSFAGSQMSDHDDHDHHDHDHEHEHSHNHNSLWAIIIVAIPLVLGFVIPAKPLGADSLNEGEVDTDFSSVSLGRSGTQTLTMIASERNVLDWARAFNSSPDIEQFIGEEANVVGFVYRDSRFGDNQFMVLRFTLTCCVADAQAVGLVVQVPEGTPRFATDTWVNIKGTFQIEEFDGDTIPILFAEEVESVDQPDQPYLYQ